jgi:salicylate hydroxylase
LQTVLVAALSALGISIKPGRRLTGIEQDDRGVSAIFASGETARGEILVAADGVRSAARALLWPGDEPRFTNHVAYRFLVSAEQAAPFMALGRSAIFIGPQRTFNRYTMAGGRVVNCAGLVETGEAVPEGWSIEAGKEEILRAFAGWHPDVLGLIGCAASSIKWGLYDRAPLRQWVVGRTVLIGDAAHAMLPFLGMGAAMAIEDGYVLAKAFALEPDPAAALARFQAARTPRTELVHAKSVEQGKITQAINPDAIDPAAIPMADQAMMAFNPVTAPL